MAVSSQPGKHIVKFAENSVIVSLLQESVSGHGPVVDDCVQWCENMFFLALSVSKTKLSAALF